MGQLDHDSWTTTGRTGKVAMDDDKLHDRRWWALAVMCLSLAVISLDNTILNVALPVLVTNLHAATSELQWIVDGYTLVFAGLLLTTGSLGDRFGRRGALSTGLAIFGLGSLASAFTHSADQLIFTRAFMGIGAALIMPATLSLLTNVFRDPIERGRAIGVWAAVAGGSGAIGPLIGGFLLRHFWWGSIFLVNVPVVIVALVAGRFLLPSSKDPAAPPLDPIGAGLSVAGLVAVLWAIIEAPAKGWTNPTVIAAFVVGVVVLFGFAEWELHCRTPHARHALLQEPPVLGGQHRHHPDVLRHVRAVLPRHPVPPGGARLHPLPGGPAGPADRPRHAGHRPLRTPAGRIRGDQGGHGRRPAAGGRRAAVG